MSDDDQKFPHLYGRQLYEAELSIAAYYMFLPTAPLRESPVGARHFACVGGLDQLWERGLAMENNGQKAELSSFVHDEIEPGDFELIDLITNHSIRQGASSGRIRQFETMVIEAATLRMIRASLMDTVQEIQNQSMGLHEALAAITGIAKVAEEQQPALELKSLDTAIKELAKKTIEAAKDGKIIGLPMFLPSMQDRLGGYRPGRFHAIVAITSGHKSTFVRASLEHMAEKGHRVLLISYEDPTDDFAGRSLVSQPALENEPDSTFTTTEVMNADFGPASQRVKRLGQFIKQVDIKSPRKQNMWIWDKPLLVDELISLMYRAVAQYKIKAIGIDFLQLIRSGNPRMDDVGHLDRLSNRLQLAAKELDVALIVAAQPTQGATHNATKNNVAIGIADVKGAAAISQACFGVLALHFPMESIETETRVGGRKQTEVEHQRIPNRIMVIPRKWKSGNQFGGPMTFQCDGAHDLISELPPKRAFYGAT